MQVGLVLLATPVASAALIAICRGRCPPRDARTFGRSAVPPQTRLPVAVLDYWHALNDAAGFSEQRAATQSPVQRPRQRDPLEAQLRGTVHSSPSCGLGI
jgi:hypothetical protein